MCVAGTVRSSVTHRPSSLKAMALCPLSRRRYVVPAAKTSHEKVKTNILFC